MVIKEIGREDLSKYFWREAILENPFLRGALVPFNSVEEGFDDREVGVIGDFRRGPRVIHKDEIITVREYPDKWISYRYIGR